MIRHLFPTAAALTLVAGSLCLTSTSRADDAGTGTTETVRTHTESSGPDMRAVGGGLFTFGVSYAVAVVVGASSTHQGDGDLYVPIVGPWMDFADRGGCPQGSCSAETGNKVLLVVDGVFQAIGVLSIASGLIFERTTVDTTTTSRAERERPSIQITPVEYAHGGLGLAAVGRF